MWNKIAIVGFPPPRAVLAFGKNHYKKGRKIKAVYFPAMTKEEDGDYDGDCDYSETEDKFYWPEGWYEWNLSEETHYHVDEIEITHWCELPEEPEC